MNTDIRRARPVNASFRAVLIAGPLLLAGCGSGGETEKPAAAPAAAQSSAPAPAQAPYVPVDACTLLTRADVEGMAGKKVLDGRKEELGELVICSFDDPEAPQVGGRALSQILTVSVMTGREGSYYAGPAAQAKDSFAMARKNAAQPEAVSGLGEDAYWDSILRKLSVVKGKYLVDVGVQSGGDPAKLARAAATKALERLPQ
jgi:hypothetical protein